MMKKLILIYILLVLIACENKEKPEPIRGYMYDTGLVFEILNADGENLLLDDNQNSYRFEEIKLFYLLEGEVVEVYRPNLDAPRKINLWKGRLTVFVNSEEKQGVASRETITYIQYNENDTDTIRSVIHETRYTTVVSKAYYNDVLVYDEINKTGFFTLIK
jgi:hypothetical protein